MIRFAGLWLFVSLTFGFLALGRGVGLIADPSLFMAACSQERTVKLVGCPLDSEELGCNCAGAQVIHSMKEQDFLKSLELNTGGFPRTDVGAAILRAKMKSGSVEQRRKATTHNAAMTLALSIRDKLRSKTPVGPHFPGDNVIKYILDPLLKDLSKSKNEDLICEDSSFARKYLGISRTSGEYKEFQEFLHEQGLVHASKSYGPSGLLHHFSPYKRSSKSRGDEIAPEGVTVSFGYEEKVIEKIFVQTNFEGAPYDLKIGSGGSDTTNKLSLPWSLYTKKKQKNFRHFTYGAYVDLIHKCGLGLRFDNHEKLRWYSVANKKKKTWLALERNYSSNRFYLCANIDHDMTISTFLRKYGASAIRKQAPFISRVYDYDLRAMPLKATPTPLKGHTYETYPTTVRSFCYEMGNGIAERAKGLAYW